MSEDVPRARPSGTSVALVHDWLTTLGGAERVLEALCQLFPAAPVYTLVWVTDGETRRVTEGRVVRASFLQHFPGGRRLYRLCLPLMPLAVESLDVSGYEVVISSNHAVAKGVRTRWDQLHISYVHTPMRYAWDLENVYLDVAGASRVMGLFARPLLHYLRTWDVAAANRVDVFVANSKHVAGRIWKLYRRRARVIYPPVNVDRFIPRADREEFYVTVTRLVPYKRVDLIVRAFARLGRPLVVVGDGPELRRLRGMASANVKVVGWQPDEVVRDYLERARAFVFAAEEDFGIGPVEAQAAGAPVIAYGRGGALESVVEGETGLFFYEQTVEAVAEAVLEFERRRGEFSVERIRANAERFRKERFQREFMALVEREWERFRKRLERFGRGQGERKAVRAGLKSGAGGE